jgi:solute carrier family 6 (neurotransmitter transporter, glycine) member 5/9
MNIVSFYFAIYYNMLIGYSIYFLYLSFGPVLWKNCNEQLWNPSVNCIDNFNRLKSVVCNETDLFKDLSGQCFNTSDLVNKNETYTPNIILVGWWDITRQNKQQQQFILPLEDFFNNYILQKSGGIDEPYKIVWQLVVALSVSSFIVFICLIKGIKSSGKIVHITVPFSFLVLIIVAIRGWMLPGAIDGIRHFLKSDISILTNNINIWYDAAIQIFFSLKIAYGGVLTLSSYNKFNEKKILRDTFLIVAIVAFMSIFVGSIVFTYIGHLALLTHQQVDQIVNYHSSGGVAFLIIPFVFTQFKGVSIYSALFFLMMIMLGIDTQVKNYFSFLFCLN